ncbi:MAG TPA: SprT family zinc-dependent metalloprotease [Afifellaceae bacterium]|nr:SprT family zinc-dependent metalloprotease [Afifellaceae bacterium]
MRIAPKSSAATVLVEIGGEAVAVPVRREPRARRMTLRIDPASGGAVATVPVGIRMPEVERFVGRHLGWIASRLQSLPPRTPFRDGGVIPLRGEPCRIVHRPGRGLVALTNGFGEPRIVVPGAPEHLPRRLGDWLKREARRDLLEAVARHAGRLGRRPSAIRVGDARSRWGSCTSRGVLSFSWRLVLAPPAVLDYLAAHEVAHLAEMNHGPAFWRLVADLHPDHARSRAWLRRHGPALHAVGRGGAV